jgi:hypothetical protein
MADRPQDTTDPVKRTDERLAEEYARLQLEIHQQGNARLIAVDYLAGLREGRALERAELEPLLQASQSAVCVLRTTLDTAGQKAGVDVADKLWKSLRAALEKNDEGGSK